MIQIQKQRPGAGDVQGRARGQNWYDYYRPYLKSLIHTNHTASFVVIAAMIRYPFIAYPECKKLSANLFTSEFTRQLGRGCLFELQGYGCIRSMELYERIESSGGWNKTTAGVYRGMIDQIPFHCGQSKLVVREILRGAINELQRSRKQVNR